VYKLLCAYTFISFYIYRYIGLYISLSAYYIYIYIHTRVKIRIRTYAGETTFRIYVEVENKKRDQTLYQPRLKG
jgi:hypothetical protein